MDRRSWVSLGAVVALLAVVMVAVGAWSAMSQARSQTAIAQDRLQAAQVQMSRSVDEAAAATLKLQGQTHALGACRTALTATLRALTLSAASATTFNKGGLAAAVAASQMMGRARTALRGAGADIKTCRSG